MGGYKVVAAFAGGTTSPNSTSTIYFSTSDWDFGVITCGVYTYTYNVSSSGTAEGCTPFMGTLYFYAGLTNCIGSFEVRAVSIASSITTSSMKLNAGIAVSGFLAKYV